MQKILPLIVLATKGSGTLLKPKVGYFNFDTLQNLDISTLGSQVQFGGELVTVAEKPLDIEALMDLANTDPFVVARLAAAQTAGATGQGNGFALAKKITEFTTVTVTTADGADLPAAVAGDFFTVINNDADTDLNVYPATGEIIDSPNAVLAVNAPEVIPAGERRAFYCMTDGVWIACEDFGI